MSVSDAPERYRKHLRVLRETGGLEASAYMECERYEMGMRDWAYYLDRRAFDLRAWILREVFGARQGA